MCIRDRVLVVPAAERELQHLHAREGAVCQQLPHTGEELAQIPVSYTHLDVYKRQVVLKAPHLVQQLVAGVNTVGVGGQAVQQLQLLGGRDVYKRQALK